MTPRSSAGVISCFRSLNAPNPTTPIARQARTTIQRRRMQISTNIHDPGVITLGNVVEVVRRHARERGARPVAAELVGLIPAAALDGYPEDVPIMGTDPHRRTIEAHLTDLRG